MSGMEMTPARMAQLIAERKSMRRERDPAALRAELAALRADRDYHHARAEAAEAEAAKLLADLADMRRVLDVIRRSHVHAQARLMLNVPPWPAFERLVCTERYGPEIASHLYPEEASK